MDNKQSNVAFNEAGQLFKNKKYNEALQILNRLNKTAPGNKEILYPMAQCMYKINRFDDAQKICEFLVKKFDHSGAKQTLKQIQAPPDPMADLGAGNLDMSNLDVGNVAGGSLDMSNLDVGNVAGGNLDMSNLDVGNVGGGMDMSNLDVGNIGGGLGMDNLDVGEIGGGIDLDMGGGSSAFGASTNQNAPAPLQRAGALEENMPIIIWVGLLIIGYIQCFFVVKGFDAQGYIDRIDELAESGAGSLEPLTLFVGPMISISIFMFIYSIFASYFSLKIVSALPNDDFSDDMKDVALYTFFCYLLSYIPFVGGICILILIYKHYELDFVKLILVVILWMFFSFISAILAVIPIFMAFSGVVLPEAS
jgi:hypothetical protein